MVPRYSVVKRTATSVYRSGSWEWGYTASFPRLSVQTLSFVFFPIVYVFPIPSHPVSLWRPHGTGGTCVCYLLSWFSHCCILSFCFPLFRRQTVCFIFYYSKFSVNSWCISKVHIYDFRNYNETCIVFTKMSGEEPGEHHHHNQTSS